MLVFKDNDVCSSCGHPFFIKKTLHVLLKPEFRVDENKEKYEITEYICEKCSRKYEK